MTQAQVAIVPDRPGRARGQQGRRRKGQLAGHELEPAEHGEDKEVGDLTRELELQEF